MKTRSLRLILSVLLLWMGGCSTFYRPLQVDPQTDRYVTTEKVDPGGILVYDTRVKPSTFPLVLLTTDSNIYPAQFAFVMREALSQLGVTRVYTPEEFRHLASDQKFSLSGDRLDSATLQRFSSTVAPVMVVEARYAHDGNSGMRATVRVRDGRTGGESLLEIEHVRRFAGGFAHDVLFPMLNELRRWYRDSSTRSV